MTTPKITDEEQKAYLAAENIFEHANMLMNKSCDQKVVAKVKTSLEKMLSDPNLDASLSDAGAVKELCKDGIEICNEIQAQRDQANSFSAATDARVKKLWEKVKHFLYKYKAKYALKDLKHPKSTDENRSGQKPEGYLAKTFLKTPKRNEVRKITFYMSFQLRSKHVSISQK